MVIETFTDPFPHLTVKNVFNEGALELIWSEIKFLSQLDKLSDASISSARDLNDNVLAKHDCLFLDEVYTNVKYSNILSIYDVMFKQKLCKSFEDIDRITQPIRYCNFLTKFGRYNNGDYYKYHHDGAYNFTAITYFHKEPKQFEGGSLKFPADNYTFECNNNTMIMFPSYIYHQVDTLNFMGNDLSNTRHYIANFFYTPSFNTPAKGTSKTIRRVE
jgi:Rps23 Pro-64 3,4-dihydroxylase Tpa1-like proline 4-hydroxylase